MKPIVTLLLLSALLLTGQAAGQTFAEWFKQTKTQKKYLALQIAKFQLYLEMMKDGYKLAGEGLGLYRDIRNGDWQQHLSFIDHLTAISAAVKGYPKVGAILATVKQANRSYTEMIPRIRSSPHLKSQSGEIDRVFQNILAELTTELNQLNTVLSAGGLSMSDEQRLKAIDAIYTRVQPAAASLQSLVKNCISMEAARKLETQDVERLQNWRH